MKRIASVALVIATGMAAASATAQLGGSDNFSFLQAIKDRDAAKVVELVGTRGATVINFRGPNDEAALHLVIRQRNSSWASYLLSNGGDPNILARNGDTPLITAARIGFDDGAEVLLRNGARIDAANRQGETALIIAVQQRNPHLVKLLLERGANPDKADMAAGYSARDYAKRDGRAADILRLIEAGKTSAKPVVGPLPR